jgi:hypothetical protein
MILHTQLRPESTTVSTGHHSSGSVIIHSLQQLHIAGPRLQLPPVGADDMGWLEGGGSSMQQQQHRGSWSSDPMLASADPLLQQHAGVLAQSAALHAVPSAPAASLALWASDVSTGWLADCAVPGDVNPALFAACLLAALTALARDTGTSSGSRSSSMSGAQAAGSGPSVDVRVSSLLELSQVILLLADEATQQGSQHAAQPSGEPCEQHGHSSLSSQQQGHSGQQAVTSSTGAAGAGGGTVSPSACGSSCQLGLSWLQDVASASMEALAHADATLRR